MKHRLYNALFILSVVLLSGCAAKKNIGTSTQEVASTSSQRDVEKEHLRLVQKVYDNRLYQQNIVADLTFTAQLDGKNITVPGALRMRKDQVVRLQLFVPFIGTEVGRLEFTPNYVLVVDRMHKEYVKADYSELSFLRENGLTFYSLQSLFWNQLMIPGKQQLADADLKQFAVEDMPTEGFNKLSLSNKQIHYEWQVNTAKGLIEQTQVDYESTMHGKSTLVWLYSAFKAFGSKQYPQNHQFTFTTKATAKQHKATVTLQLNQPTTNSDWEAETSISSKYKRVETDDILGKILSM